MKSVAIIAALVGLASAGGWEGNYTAPHEPTSLSSWDKPTGSWGKSTSSSSSSSWVVPTSSSSWLQPTYPKSSSSWVKPSGTGVKTASYTTYTTETICPYTSVSSGTTITALTTSTIVVTSCKGGCPTHSVPAPPYPITSSLTTWVPSVKPSMSHPASNTTSTKVVYTTVTTCPVTTTYTHSGKTFVSTYTTVSTLTQTVSKASHTTWGNTTVPASPTTQTVWTTTLPQTNTKYSTKVITYTSCGPAGCSKTTVAPSVPAPSVPASSPASSVPASSPPSSAPVSSPASSAPSVVATTPAPSAPASPASSVPASSPASSAPSVEATTPAPSAPASFPAPSASSALCVVSQISDGQVQAAYGPCTPESTSLATSVPAESVTSATSVLPSSGTPSTTATQPSVSVFTGAGAINKAPIAVAAGLMALAALF